MIVGYGRLIEMEPKLIYKTAFQKHLIILLDLIDGSGHQELRKRSGRILEQLMSNGGQNAA